MTCYLIDKSLLIVLELKTPYEVWYGSPVDYSSMKVFGCLVYAHVKEDKLRVRERKYIFLSHISIVVCSSQVT
jgi:ATP-binding cassette subfamily B (MDR/TAP) protein 1